jgi:hypothetical protein
MIVDTALQTYNKAIEKLLPFFANKKNRYSCIGAAIVCILFRQIYSSIALPPRNLRQFPRVSTYAILSSFKKKEAVPKRIKRLINPITDAGYSFYMVRNQHILQTNHHFSFYIFIIRQGLLLHGTCL